MSFNPAWENGEYDADKQKIDDSEPEIDEAAFIEAVNHYNNFTVRLASREGFDRIPREVMRRSDITACAKLVYANIAGRIYKGHQFCIPGIETIAEDTGTSTATVKRALSELVGRELIIRVDRGRKSNLYRLPKKAELQ
jgi:hypothetical protein